jgi:transposase
MRADFSQVIMRFIQGLSSETTSLLKRIYKQSKHSPVRQRAHCILLSSEGFAIGTLMEILGVSRETIYNWLNAWQAHHFVGLYDRPGRGRKPTFDAEQREQIRAWVKQNPKNLRLVLQKIQAQWQIKVSLDTLKRVLKSLSMSWLRVRRVVAGAPDPAEYELKKAQLAVLKAQDDRGEIDLRYLDETGFCLIPYVPYAWQERGERLEIPSQQSQRVNVLGLMNRAHQLDPYVFTGSITSTVVITCIDEFCKTCQKLTVIVMDQASIHTSELFQAKKAEWEAQQVTIFALPAYSPELNLIEILWRFMKYEWIEFSAYESWQSLNEYLDKVLKGFGKDYVINFA